MVGGSETRPICGILIHRYFQWVGGIFPLCLCVLMSGYLYQTQFKQTKKHIEEKTMKNSKELTIDAHLKTMLHQIASKQRGAGQKHARKATIALNRMDAGTYGFCILCGIKIPELRLLAKPEGIHCEKCK